MHVLLAEDDLDLGAALLAALKLDGISARWVRSAAQARAAIGPECDAVLLDLGLPDGEGLQLLRDWRAAGVVLPLMIITARATLDTRLAGLDAGADDVLVKPFAVPELVARLRAVQRRSMARLDDQWAIGALQVRPREGRALRHGQALPLSAREFQILCELARAAGAAVAKPLLGARLQPLGDPVDVATIEVHVSNLRRKLGDAACIETVRGVGYRLVPA